MPVAVGNGIHVDPVFDSIARSYHLDGLVGKRIVFVSPGYVGKRFIFEKAHELGVRSVIIDSPGSWSTELYHEGLVERVLEVDMSQAGDKIKMDCIEALSSVPSGFDGICTFVELSTSVAASLCEHFKVPGHSVGSVELARDKYLTRKAVSATEETQQYGIRSSLIEDGTELEIRRAADYVGFPAVLKPVSGAASLGVQRVDSLDELRETYISIKKLISQQLVVSSGALERRIRMESDVNNPILSYTNSSLENGAILLEEYITGHEVDIDMVLNDGKVTFCEISDNGPTVEPYFGETYNSCPSLLSMQEQDQLKEMAFLITTKSLGFRSGVFHVEGKMTRNGPRLIEVNCRMGGGPIRTVHMARSGVDLVVEQLLLAAGIPSVPPVRPKDKQLAVGFVDVNARRSGSVASLEFLKQFAQRKGMLYCKPLVTVGEHIVGPEEGQPSWLAEAVFTTNTAEEAHSLSLTLYKEIQNLFETHYVLS